MDAYWMDIHPLGTLPMPPFSPHNTLQAPKQHKNIPTTEQWKHHQ
jgi:hypothetical protein